MPDGSRIRLKCPLCAQEVVARPEEAGRIITCDFCLEEFTAPAIAAPPAAPAVAPSKPAAPSKPVAPAAKAETEVSLDLVEQSSGDVADRPPTAGSSPDVGFELGELGDDEFSFADELPDATPPSGPGPASRPPAGAPAQPPDEQWLRIDEDLTRPDEDFPAKKAVLTSDYEFSGPCPLCATRFVATDDQIGTSIRCPDCHTVFEIREPLPGARQPRRRGGGSDDDDDFRLSDPDALFGISSPSADPLDVSSPTGDPLGTSSPLDDPLGSLEALDALDTDTALPLGNSVRPMPVTASWPRDQPGTGSQNVLADAALRKAEAELDEQVIEQAELPANPLVNGTWKCFSDPSVLIRWFLVAVAIQVEISAINGTIERAMLDDAMAQFMGMMMGVFVGLFGVGLLVGGSVTLLAITQDTASGRDRIESWPDANFMDWVFDALYVVCALVVSLVAGVVAGQIFRPFGMTIYVCGLIAALAFSFAAVFPFYLLATLETGLPVNPFSLPVIRSLKLARGTWIQFACMSVGLAVVAVLGWQFRRAEWMILNFVSAAIIVGVAFVYFRLLGRLTWTCQEAVAEEDRRREAAAEQESR